MSAKNAVQIHTGYMIIFYYSSWSKTLASWHFNCTHSCSSSGLIWSFFLASSSNGPSVQCRSGNNALWAIEMPTHHLPLNPWMANVASLKRQVEKYCSLIRCERKTLFFRWKSTSHKTSEQEKNISSNSFISAHATIIPESAAMLVKLECLYIWKLKCVMYCRR